MQSRIISRRGDQPGMHSDDGIDSAGGTQGLRRTHLSEIVHVSSPWSGMAQQAMTPSRSYLLNSGNEYMRGHWLCAEIIENMHIIYSI